MHVLSSLIGKHLLLPSHSSLMLFLYLFLVYITGMVKITLITPWGDSNLLIYNKCIKITPAIINFNLLACYNLFVACSLASFFLSVINNHSSRIILQSFLATISPLSVQFTWQGKMLLTLFVTCPLLPSWHSTKSLENLFFP